MNLRSTVLLTGLFAFMIHGQATTPTQAATPGNAAGPNAGARPTRANGVPPTAPGLSGTGTGAANANNAGANNRGSNASGSPAPAATGTIEVIGRPSGVQPASYDKPLLPIPTPGNALGVASGTPIRVNLRSAVDSGHARNGDMLNGTLAAPVAGLPVGTPVQLTVVSAAKAGQLTSYGELSLQVVSIGNRRILSDTVSAQGKEGPKELPDAAPALGTEAILTPEQTITLPAA